MSAGIRTLVKSGQTEDRIPVINQDIRALAQVSDVLVTVEIFHAKRTIPQNNFFRGMCREIANYWNACNDDKTSPEAVAEDLKGQYGVIITEYSPVTGTRSARLKSTAKYETHEMSSLLDATLAWAAEHSIPLKDPRC